MPDGQAVRRPRDRVLAGDDGEEILGVERLDAAGELLLVARPDGPVAVPGQLEAVAVGIGEVDRLVGAVVRGPLDRGPRDRDPHGDPRELRAGAEQEGHVVQAGVAGGRASGRVLVEDEHVAPAGAERRLAAVAAVHAKPDHALVERECALQAGDGQVDRPEARRVRQPRLGRGGGEGLACLHGYACLTAEMSRASLTLSDTSRLPLPSAWLKVMPKSPRLS